MSEWMYRLTQEDFTMTEINRAQQDEQYSGLINRYASYQRKSVEGILGLTKVIYDAVHADHNVCMRFLAKIGHTRDSSYIKKCMIIGKSYPRLIDLSLNLPPHFESLYVIASMNAMQVSVSIHHREISHRSTLKEIKALKPTSGRRQHKSFIHYEGRNVDKTDYKNNFEGVEARIYFPKSKALINQEIKDFFTYIQQQSKELGLGIDFTRMSLPDLPSEHNEAILALPAPAKAA